MYSIEGTLTKEAIERWFNSLSNKKQKIALAIYRFEHKIEVDIGFQGDEIGYGLDFDDSSPYIFEHPEFTRLTAGWLELSSKLPRSQVDKDFSAVLSEIIDLEHPNIDDQIVEVESELAPSSRNQDTEDYDSIRGIFGEKIKIKDLSIKQKDSNCSNLSGVGDNIDSQNQLKNEPEIEVIEFGPGLKVSSKRLGGKGTFFKRSSRFSLANKPNIQIHE